METLDPSDLRELYDLSAANGVGLSLAAFGEALRAVGERYLPSNVTYRQAVSFYRNLHLKDFALAQSCAIGNTSAWECFLERFSGRLYAAAMVIARNEHIARELSDSLAGDLFASKKPSGERCSSKMASYSGRGSLEGWLKALLTRTYVDRYRSQRRMVSLEYRIDILKNLCVNQDVDRTETDPRLNIAIEEAFLQRSPEERFLLAAYFFDRWTLAEIASVLGIHESSVSRRMDRLLLKLRKTINHRLQKTGMSLKQILESFDSGGWELSSDVRKQLLRSLVRE